MHSPQPLSALSRSTARDLVGVFCDIDDTLTHDGRLHVAAYAALQALHDAGLRVVPVTGRPGGWVDLIARQWPVDGVVGENGGLWAFRDGQRMQRHYLQAPATRVENREKLRVLAERILIAVPGCALASDQAYRDLDLAIDFCEDVPALPPEDIAAITACFTEAGATSKVSSIHVNGWFGDFDKHTGCRRLVTERWGEDLDAQAARWLYVGDSANDEPMFAAFPHACGVANVRRFLPQMKAWPAYIAPSEGGAGFAEIAAHILALRKP